VIASDCRNPAAPQAERRSLDVRFVGSAPVEHLMDK
jgi:hypothetical protein